MLGLWRKPARLLVVRNGNPLSFAETTGGFYFGSLPGELPGRVLSITDEYAGVLTYTEDGLRHEAFSIER
jgi:hypothetical protein